MPSGLTHAAITTAAAATLYWGLPHFGVSDPMTIYATVGGCMVGVILTPDLDVEQPTRSHYVIYRKFGAIPFLVWRAIWYPYGLAIGHRSWVSHMPVISTLIRLGYLGGFLWVGLALFAHQYSLSDWVGSAYSAFGLWAIGGLMVSDSLHWLADIISTGIKRRIHRHRGRKARRIEER